MNGQQIGYRRVSSVDQNTARQLAGESKTAIARDFKVSRETIYSYLRRVQVRE